MSPLTRLAQTQPGATTRRRPRATSLPRDQAGSRKFDGQRCQVRQVRAFAASFLDGCPVRDDVILCVSELSANTVVHSRSGEDGGRFTVRIEVHPQDYVWVEVEDEGGPWEKPADDSMPGHGLDIVAKLASDWGTDGDIGGWIVWARIDWPAV